MAVYVDFSWTGTGAELSYEVGGNHYPYSTQADGIIRASDERYASYVTPINTDLTFTADVIITSKNLSIIQYRWDFGDGTIGYGPTINHTYFAAAPQTQALLNITDNLGNVYGRHKAVNLVP